MPEGFSVVVVVVLVEEEEWTVLLGFKLQLGELYTRGEGSHIG